MISVKGSGGAAKQKKVEQATPSITVDANGKITATATQEEGYVAEGTKSATKQLTTQAAKTVTPTTSEQTVVGAEVYTTGAIKVAAVPTETKTVTPSTSAQDITPSSGKFLNKVTVNGIDFYGDDFYGVIERAQNEEGYPTDVLFKLNHVMTLGSSSTYPYGSHFDYVEDFEIVCDTLLEKHFSNVSGASNDNKKIKLKCKTVANKALNEAFNRTGGSAKLWISSSCETIDKASSWGNAPFTYSPATTMYCEPETKPSGWGSMWNYKYGGSAMTTYYGITEEAFDAL